MAGKRRSRKPTERRGKRVFIYVRVSDTTGREDTLISPEVQLNECKGAVAREGFEVIEVITDLDKSGRTSDQRQVAAIINRIERGEADGVVVWKISRWGRNTMDSLLNIGELQEAGGFIVSATENLADIDTPAGKFSLTVLLAIAQMFSDEIGKTWANIHDYRLTLGKTITATPRLGYLRVKDIPEAERSQYEIPDGVDHIPDPKVAPWIAKAFEWLASGMSLVKVSERLNAAGVRSVRGNELKYGTLRRSFDGGFHAGLVVDRRGDEEVFIEGKHEAIVSRELWEAYRAKIQDETPPRAKNAAHRTSRLVYCYGCGLRLTPTHKKHRQVDGVVTTSIYWRCARAMSGKSANTTCSRPAYVAGRSVEDALLDWLKLHAEGDQAVATQVARARKAQQAEVDVAKLERDIARQHKRLSILTDKMIDGAISEAAGKMKEAEILGEIRALESAKLASASEVKVNSLPDQTVFGALMLGWDAMPVEVQNEALHKVVGKIIVRRSDIHKGKPRVIIVGRWEDEEAVLAAA